MALPLKTTADDLRSIAKYLKTKPTGATVTEAKAIDKKMVDSRKLAAYVTWKVVERDDAKLKLTERGSRLARYPERDAEVFQEVVSLMKPYKSAIEMAHQTGLDTLDTNDVATQWHEHHTDAVGSANENTLRENAVCFFNIAEAAGLGKVTVGRKGSATRINLDGDRVAAFIEAGPSTPPFADTPDAAEGQAEVEAAESEEQAGAPEEERLRADLMTSEPGEPLRVFISHGSNRDIVDQIEVVLGVADIEPEIAVEEETAAIPVPEKVLNAMRRCRAGIIAVTVDENRKDEDGNYTLNENVLIEIGSAFVLYDQRVVLVWDKRLKVPSNLQGLYRCEFEGDELSWSEGMKLMKAVKEFKTPQD